MAEDIDAGVHPGDPSTSPNRRENFGFISMGIDRAEKGGLYNKLRNEFEKGDNSSYDPDYPFLNLLDRTIPRIDFTPPQEGPMTILDLACGECHEGFGIKAFFAGETAAYDDVRLFGIDIDEDRINRAGITIDRFERKFFGLPEPTTPSYEFYCGDATNLNDLRLPTQADVVVIRNQLIIDDIEGAGQIWEEIFRQGYLRLTDNGIMIVTSRSKVEHENALRGLRRLDPDFLLDEENPDAIIDYEDEELVTGRDKYIVIIRKKRHEEQT